MRRRLSLIILGMLLALATGLGLGIPGGALADIGYPTCPSFATFQSDVQAISGSGTINFVAANCTLDATSSITFQTNATVTISGNGLTLSGGTAVTHGKFSLFNISSNDVITLENMTLQYADDGVDCTGGVCGGTVTLINGNVHHNVDGLQSAHIIALNSSIYDNQSTGIAGSTVSLTNSTVSGNALDGVEYAASATISNSTVTGNSMYGIHNVVQDGGPATVVASLIASNGTNCDQTETDRGYNLSTDASCGLSALGSQNSVDATSLHLGALGDFGGPTLTIPLLPGSVAIDAIPTGTVSTQTVCLNASGSAILDPSTSQPVITDQRGVARPQGTNCDIGAYEAATMTTTTVASSATAVDSDVSVTLSATVAVPTCAVPNNDCGFVNQGIVTFSVTNASSQPVGSSFQGSVVSGSASADFDSTGLAIGDYTITASYHDASGLFPDSQDTDTLSITIGPPANVNLVPGDTIADVGGTTTQTATISDVDGILVPDGTQVDWAISGTGSATASITHQDTTTTDGEASITYTNTTAAADTLQATAGTTSGFAVVTWIAGPPGSLSLSPGDTSAEVGGTTTETATVLDQYGNAVPDGTTVNFSVTDTNSTSGSATTVAGQTTFSYSGTLAGSDTLTATAVGGSTPYDTATIIWTPGSAMSLTLTPGDTKAMVGSSTTETATITDQYGNLVADGTAVHWDITGPVSGTASISLQDATTTNGQANLTYTNTTVGVDTVAAVAGTTPDTASDSTSVTWTPESAAKLTLSPGNTNGTIGLAVNETATVTDKYGNDVADGTSVSFSVTGSNPTSGNATTVNGQTSFTYSGTLAGADTLTAIASGGITPAAVATIIWGAPVSTPRATLTIVNPFSPQIDVVVQTGAIGGITVGVLTYNSQTIRLTQVQLTALEVNGSQATLYGQALANGTPVTFRLDATQGRVFGTVRLRLSNGYDSGNQSLLVRVTP